MNKYPLIGVSICAVVLLVLGSLSNVVGYQQVQSSNQQIIKEQVNQKELLFQTILDIANNKEIQRIILKSQMSKGIFPASDIPAVTKNQLKHMYLIGLILSKVISRSRMQSMVGKYQFGNQEIRQEINTVIEKNPTLNVEITQLQAPECDCQDESGFPACLDLICGILYLVLEPIFNFLYELSYHPDYFIRYYAEFLLRILEGLYSFLCGTYPYSSMNNTSFDAKRGY